MKTVMSEVLLLSSKHRPLRTVLQRLEVETERLNMRVGDLGSSCSKKVDRSRHRPAPLQ